MPRFPLGRALTAVLSAATLVGGVPTAAHAAVRAPARVTSAMTAPRPWSYAWREQYLAMHRPVNHVHAAGMVPQLSAGRYLYVADYNSSIVFLYNANATNNPSPVGFIADGVSAPASVAFDVNHNLYVANEGTSNVTVYRPGSSTVAKTIATIFPLAITLATDGTLYVAGYNGSLPEIEIIAPGKAPTYVLSPNGAEPDAIALSPSNTLIVGANTQNEIGTIYEFALGATTGTARFSTIGALDGVTFDTAGNLYVGNFNENAIYEYSPSYSLLATQQNGVYRPIGLTMDDNELFVADSGAQDVSAYRSFAANPTYFQSDLTFPTSSAVTYVSPVKASTTEKTIYLSDEQYSEIHRFAANPRAPIEGGFISQGVTFPQGLWMESSGKLWAANYGAHTVTWFAPNSSVPGGFLNGLGKPFAVTVDHKGVVYVADQGAQDIAIYNPGATKPSRSVSCGGLPQFMAVDAADNLYVSCVGQTEGVVEFAPGATTGTPLTLNGLNFPRGIAFDASGNMYVADMLDSTIFVYAPGSSNPLRTITSGLSGPEQITIGASGRLYVANTSGDRNPIYAPGGTVPIGIFPANGIGIAVH